MAAGSRKRRRPDGRTASPPLGPSPLLARNLNLLPVGLTQLPNDETFVVQLRHDVNDLLSAFSEALLLKLTQEGQLSAQTAIAGPSSSAAIPEDVLRNTVSPFSVFAQMWIRKGWHYVQFAFADHTESKRAMGDAICRVLLEHLEPYLRTQIRDDSQIQEQQCRMISFTDVKQLFKIMAVPFALYLFWSSQIYPTSGIGVKHCRPAMERIPIEQDYYDLLLDLPEAIAKRLKEERTTNAHAEAAAADLTEVLCLLIGQVSDGEGGDLLSMPVLSAAQAKSSSKSGGRQPWQDDTTAGQHSRWIGTDTVFDIIPASNVATRLPRNWPSVHVMSSLEANKEFGRIGTVVRISSTAEEGSARAGTTEPKTEEREAVAGLSRGDVVRLKARQRLAMASFSVSKLLGQPTRSAATPGTAAPSDLLAQTAPRNVADTSSRSTRYEVEVPVWIKSAKYTAKMQPWLEEASATKQESVRRVARSKQRYREARDKIMRADANTTTGAEDDRQSASRVDYGEWVLRSFREERQALQNQVASVTARRTGSSDDHTGNLPNVNDAGTLSMDSLYRLAAERTKTAAVERGEMLKSAKASSLRLQ
ncbi:hypothetical protein PSEUBRA_006367 [Kalmanozyma brasiliensis GHG001]|uniref:uncharacterized protein n=1 Tax=Kalmanozyma brasiliensis (strain GHG001) TaxID=1365824 RepID=UPI002867F9EA|nr:uncharacterized protein PSEUBRA_006367 [Kalmanozyma brasiliensis GHG001]KAF6767669.1 hypothetical protein PSEUBRA_006367 [Kalmanozyma brasiliensis GHG001]